MSGETSVTGDGPEICNTLEKFQFQLQREKKHTPKWLVGGSPQMAGSIAID